jgi:hypothetical protein
MRGLNIILVFVLILLTGFMFTISNHSKYHIGELKKMLDTRNKVIQGLKADNDTINYEVSILKDSITEYKHKLVLYEDSLIKIKAYYGKVSKDVYDLDDSASYEFFSHYVRANSKRYSISTD